MYESSDFSPVDKQFDWLPDTADSGDIKKPDRFKDITTPDFCLETMSIAAIDNWSQIETNKPIDNSSL